MYFTIRCSKMGFVAVALGEQEAGCVHAEVVSAEIILCELALKNWEMFEKTHLNGHKPEGAGGFEFHPISGNPCFKCLLRKKGYCGSFVPSG